MINTDKIYQNYYLTFLGVRRVTIPLPSAPQTNALPIELLTPCSVKKWSRTTDARAFSPAALPPELSLLFVCKMGFEPTSSPSQGDVLNQLDDLQRV